VSLVAYFFGTLYCYILTNLVMQFVASAMRKLPSSQNDNLFLTEMQVRLFFTRSRLLFQDQDQDFAPQNQDQDLYTVSDNLAKDSCK